MAFNRMRPVFLKMNHGYSTGVRTSWCVSSWINWWTFEIQKGKIPTLELSFKMVLEGQQMFVLHPWEFGIEIPSKDTDWSVKPSFFLTHASNVSQNPRVMFLYKRWRTIQIFLQAWLRDQKDFSFVLITLISYHLTKYF